jgi:ribosome-associated protein
MIRVTDHIAIADSELSYQFTPSSGPGGQNVNKLATAAHLRFDVDGSLSLPGDVVRRLRSLAGKRMSADGVILIKAQRYRTQERNKEDALARLVSLISRAAEPPRLRRATAPSRASIQRRLDTKARRGQTKRSRGPITDG